MSTDHDSCSRSSSGMHWFSSLFITLCLFFIPIKQADAATVPVGFQDQQVATGITSPTALTTLPDGRVLVVQQNGVIRIVKGDVMLGTSFWTVPNVDATNERGCLGVVADPDFATNRWVYIYCSIINGTGTNNRIIRVTEANDRMVLGSEQIIFSLPNIPSGVKWHQGGAMKFGPDGKLYFATGNNEDNPVAPPSNAQLLSNPFGKMHRINKDGTIPTDNPYASRTDSGRSIWNRGFRNNFAFDIQPGTGRMMIGDVGQSSREEIDDGVRDGNYGWPYFEGTIQRVAPPAGFNHRAPFFEWDHTGACAVTGVAFYNPPTAQFPASYVGKLLFQDFCQGTIRLIDPASTAANRGLTSFVSGISFPTNMSVAQNGSLYYLARNQQTGAPNPGGGSLHKITFTGSQAPRCSLLPESVTVSIGGSNTFRAGADGATSLQWQRADSATPTSFTNITGATTATYTLSNAQLSDNGDRFRMLATNSFGSTPCGPATLTVTSNRFPSATITAPADGAMFNSGQVFAYSGTGTDPDDGTLPGTSMTWQVDFQHDTHTHPFIAPHTGTGGSFTADPGTDALEPNMWYRIFLTVTDSGGLQSFSSRDVYPDRQLSTMNPVGTPTNGWGPVERNMSNGETAAGDGRTITLDGVPYAKGWGVHAPSEMVFNIAGCSGEFISHVGVDDEVGASGSVVFQVYLDGVQAYDSGLMTGTTVRKYVRVNIAGKSQLRLVVTDGGNGVGSDHASWAGPRVTGCSATPVLSITNLNVRDTTNAADWSVRSNLQTGDQSHGDRTFTWSSVPASVAGSAWVRTANDSKTYTGNPLVSFSISAAANVYVAWDDRLARPAWLDSTWVDTGENLVVRESSTVTRALSLFRKSFAAGSVSLGPVANSSVNNYSVIVK
jgi:glucose/arabinose dehydrogenase